MQPIRSIKLLLPLLIILLASAQGCSEDYSGDRVEPLSTVSGVAAAGAPISGNSYLKDYTGHELGPTAIGADGGFSFDVTGLVPPFILKAEGNSSSSDYTEYSLATTAGTANINPLTSIILASVTNVNDPSLAYDSPSSFTITDELIDRALELLATTLALLYDFYDSAGADPLRDSFTADSTGLDALLDDFDILINSGIVTINHSGSGEAVGVVSLTDIANPTDPIEEGEVIGLSAPTALPGTLKWSYATGDVVHTSPAIGPDGTIYFGSHDNHFYAMNPDGTLKWGYDIGDMLHGSATIIPDGTIYIGTRDSKLYAFNPDGTLIWSYATGLSINATPAITADGTIYMGSQDNNLYALNPDGTLKWSYTVVGGVYSSPAIASDGTLYFGAGFADPNDPISGDPFDIYALNPDGTLKWSYTTGGEVAASPAIDSDGTIYTGSADNYLYALNPDGTLKWRYATGGWVWSSVAIGTDGTLYFGSYDNNLYALNPDGTLKWTFTADDWVRSSAAIGADGTIYIGASDSNLYAINPDGTLKWLFAMGGSTQSCPTLADDGTLYIGSNDARLYAIHTESGGLADTPWPKFHRDIEHTGRQ